MPRPRRDVGPVSPIPPGDGRSGGFLGDLVGLVRWAVLPFGLVALVAVGVHAAADTVDDRLLRVVERADAWLDSALGAWSATQVWIDWIGPGERVRIARLLALAWELLADAILIFPVLAFRAPGGAGKRQRRVRISQMLVLRPLATAAICLAGACAVARMVQGAVYLSALDRVGEAAGPLARGLALAVLAGVLLAVGSRAVVGSFRHAREALEEAGPRSALTGGLWGSALVVPLAVAAMLDASPVLSFFR